HRGLLAHTSRLDDGTRCLAESAPAHQFLRLRVGPSNWQRSRRPILWQGLRRRKKTFELELQAGLRAIQDTESKRSSPRYSSEIPLPVHSLTSDPRVSVD